MHLTNSCIATIGNIGEHKINTLDQKGGQLLSLSWVVDHLGPLE